MLWPYCLTHRALTIKSSASETHSSGALDSGIKEVNTVRADEKLAVFVELQRAIHAFAVSLCVLGENVHEN